MTARASRKHRSQAPQLSPKRAAQLKWLEQSAAKYRARRQAHPRRDIALNLLFGVPVTIGAVWFFLPICTSSDPTG